MHQYIVNQMFSEIIQSYFNSNNNSYYKEYTAHNEYPSNAAC